MFAALLTVLIWSRGCSVIRPPSEFQFVDPLTSVEFGIVWTCSTWYGIVGISRSTSISSWPVDPCCSDSLDDEDEDDEDEDEEDDEDFEEYEATL